MNYKLEELIDINLLQSLQEKLNRVYSFPSAIIDNNGKVLTAVAWQDICTKFHRQNPESEKECVKSDKFILEHLNEADPAVSYKCPHGLIDNATPIIIEGQHLGNFFTGQFFLDEKPEIEFFKKQAEKYGFNQEEYLEAVNKVPVWTKEKLDLYLDFVKTFIEIIAGLGLKSIKELDLKNQSDLTNKKLLEEIEERKKVEAELNKSQLALIKQNELFSSLLKNLQIGIFMVESPGGKPLIANEAALTLLGRGILPDANKSNLSEIYKARKADTNEIYPAEEMPIVLGMQGITSHIDDMLVERPDGTKTYLEVFGSPITDINGEVWASLVSFTDITNRRETEKEIKESQEKLNALFSSMTEMVVLHELVFDEKGLPFNYKIIDCNKAFTEVTGIKKEFAVGKLATEVYSIDTAPYLDLFSQVAITGKPYEYTTYYQPMDKHFSISVVSPKKNQFATVTTDITAIKQIEEVISTKNKELENYLYIASHDLRSPLVNIQGFSQRLKKKTDSLKELLSGLQLDDKSKSEINLITDDSIPKTLEFINTNVLKMDTLLNGLLQISRTGRVMMVIENIDMNRLMESIIKAKKFQIDELNASIIIQDKLPSCYGDYNLLNQLFSNIIGNALKYRDIKRNPLIEISGEINFKKVIYKIKDNGIGISKRHIEKIWDVFYRVDPKTQEPGEGLGLSIVKRITDKHKGKIWVESEIGIGTIFFVELQRNNFIE